jgi:hypothetical protein
VVCKMPSSHFSTDMPGGGRAGLPMELVTPAFVLLDLFPSLFHELLMAGQGIPQGLQAFAQLLAVPGLLLDDGAQLLSQTFPLLVGAGRQLLSLFLELLLVPLPRLLHVLHRLLHGSGQRVVQTSALLVEGCAGGLQLILATLLQRAALGTAAAGTVGAFGYCRYRRQDQSHHYGYGQIPSHNISRFYDYGCPFRLLYCTAHAKE